VLWVLGAVSASVIVVAVLSSPWFYVRNVTISGLGQLASEEVRAAAAASTIPDKTSIIRAQTHAMELRLKRLPFVAEAHVSRRLPATLAVTITARKPIALLDNGSTRWEIDREGIPIREARPEMLLPMIVVASNQALTAGLRVSDDGVVGGINAFRLCRNSLLSGVSKIDVDPDADLCLNMNDGVVIRLGQPEELQKKLALAERIYEERPDVAAEVEAIDLRCPDAPACTPRKKDGSRHSLDAKHGRQRSRADGAQLLQSDIGRISSRNE